jgi:hypothetical protein
MRKKFIEKKESKKKVDKADYNIKEKKYKRLPSEDYIYI